MSETSYQEEPPATRAFSSADTTESPTLIPEALPKCSETSSPSPRVQLNLIVSSPVVKEALIPLPVSPTSSSITLGGSKPGITERQENGFLRRWQRWDWIGGYWKSYEYVDVTPPAATESNFFCLNVRRKSDNERPKLVLSDFNPILLTCLRTIVGGNCLSKHPEVPIDELLLGLAALDARANDAQVSLMKENNEDGIIQCARALGHEGLHDGDARKYLMIAVQQLESLLLLLKEEFKPIRERLKHAVAHGRVPRDLLEFYFRKGQKYYYKDNNGDFEAFRLISTDYDDFAKTFTLNGENFFWNGIKWVKFDDGRMFKLSEEGSLDLTDVLTVEMTPEICGQLTERGRKYHSLAGVHHRLYRGRRIMIDRLAWNTFGYIQQGDESPLPLLQDRSKVRTNEVIPPVPEENIDLLPRFMQGFDLERKAWAFFDVDEIMPIKFNDNAWKHIVLEESSKTMIEKIVGAFDFSKEVIEGEEETGLVILLHGPSGAGKTATVVAIAEHFGRPLYSLSIGTLPVDTTLLGDMLISRLDVARTWNAIVLIEAGDILLQTQGQNDPIMEEHIRISTVLEFFQQHRCIVFVTARATSPLYMSHFALTIQYRELDADSRQTLWSNMLASEGDHISYRDIEELSRVAVNGRAMSNIHTTAKVLARSSNQPLSLHHLKTAAKMQGQVEGAGYHLYW